MMQKFTLVFSSLSMAVAVMLGAFGAHGLKGIISADRLTTFHTAVNYQVIHSLALLVIVILMYHIDERYLKYPAILLMLGIVLFSGSLYLLVISGKTWPGAITPLGGLTFIAGWIWLAITSITRL